SRRHIVRVRRKPQLPRSRVVIIETLLPQRVRHRAVAGHMVTSYSYASSTTNTGWSTTVTDAAGKKKIYVTDALGRVITVYEDPNGANYAASYFYDPLGDLTGVVQGYCPSCQSRTFAYDSLQRLTDATNPESGHVHYDWDSAGNLVKRTDNRGFITQYTPDALGRVSAISYSDGTPGVSFAYDTVSAYGKGRLASVCTGSYQCESMVSYL